MCIRDSAVTERHIFGNTENLACGAVFQQAHGFVFRKPQPPQAVVIYGVRILSLIHICIGEKTVVSIIGYRDRLGGFLRAEQLAEVPGVTERNYEKILKQIYCDSCEIRKIDRCV